MIPTSSLRVPPTLSRLAAVLFLSVLCAGANSQQGTGGEGPADLVEPTTAEVRVDGMPADGEIRERLRRIYAATRWFEDLDVEVSEGMVSLRGVSSTADHAEWAVDLARRTEGVVGVADHLVVQERISWSLAPAWDALRSLARDVIERAPLVGIGLLVLAVTALLAWLTSKVARRILERRLSSRMLADVASTLCVLPVVVVGVYVFLQVAGLTRLAATVLGGTGLAGLIVGIAFRDVAENFLASVLISIKRPFRIGHLIEVQGEKGYVQAVTTRGTLLMTLEGNHVHVPNADVYKNTVYNFSANPRTRFDFTIGVDYSDSAARAQEVCLGALRAHTAVLDEPEPLVLVEELGSSSVLLRVHFWVNIHEFSGNKVRSSVIRKVKTAIEDAGLTMPDDAREVLFPQGVPVRMQPEEGEDRRAKRPDAGAPLPKNAAEEVDSTEAEGGLKSESEEIRRQAGTLEALDLGADLVEAEAEADAVVR